MNRDTGYAARLDPAPTLRVGALTPGEKPTWTHKPRRERPQGRCRQTRNSPTSTATGIESSSTTVIAVKATVAHRSDRVVRRVETPKDWNTLQEPWIMWI